MKTLLNKEIKNNAELFRSKIGIGPTEPICLESFLLKKNITTLFKSMSGSFSGMAIKVNDERRFILVNQNHTKGRQNFTIAHELYHLFVQNDFKSQKCITGLFEKQRDTEERKADVFAACFLMPENGVVEMITEKERTKRNLISTETLFKIQHYYSVSLNAMIYRLIELGYIDKTYYDKYESGKKTTALKLGYDVSLYEKANENKIIGDYAAKATLLYENKMISEAEYLRLLNAVNIDPFKTVDENNED